MLCQYQLVAKMQSLFSAVSQTASLCVVGSMMACVKLFLVPFFRSPDQSINNNNNNKSL